MWFITRNIFEYLCNEDIPKEKRIKVLKDFERDNIELKREELLIEEIKTLEVNGVFPYIGFAPNVELFNGFYS